MEIDEQTRRYYDIFHPGAIQKILDAQSNSARFVYYTSAETAIKILSGRELWFRNASVMNDFSEISYGIGVIKQALDSEAGAAFRGAIDSVCPGTFNQFESHLAKWIRDWQLETYLACVSMHDKREDDRGRLSMWRAYGDTALVVHGFPMTRFTDALGVYSAPVRYASAEDAKKYLSDVTHGVCCHRDYLSSLGQNTILAYLHSMFLSIAITTKHPGFEEEREWRIYYRPSDSVSGGMTKKTVVLNGVPQTVYKLRLEDDPKSGLDGLGIPNILDRVIIGPTEFPWVSYKAFVDVLDSVGVQDPEEKVKVSDVPLRVR